MLLELQNVRQIPGERRRRWFSSPDLDLIVWIDTDDKPAGFELCYDKKRQEKALRWSPSGFAHMVVDDGEGRPGRHKSSPVLTGQGAFDADRIYKHFIAECRQLPEEIMNFIMSIFENSSLFTAPSP